jgi:hypothetical protein
LYFKHNRMSCTKIFNKLNNYMEQSTSWEANSSSASQEITCIL